VRFLSITLKHSIFADNLTKVAKIFNPLGNTRFGLFEYSCVQILIITLPYFT